MTEPTDGLRNAVGATCHRLQEGYLAAPDSPAHHSARAALAELRHGGTTEINKDPLGLEKVLFAMQGDFSERLAGKSDAPSPSERAAFVAITLFGIHMQGASERMHVPGRSFTSACGYLFALNKSDSIKPRIDAMLLASSENARLTHIRSLVTLLRSHSIGFDYGLLARDLRSLSDPQKRSGVQLRWGREFAGAYFHKTNSSN